MDRGEYWQLRNAILTNRKLQGDQETPREGNPSYLPMRRQLLLARFQTSSMKNNEPRVDASEKVVATSPAATSATAMEGEEGGRSLLLQRQQHSFFPLPIFCKRFHLPSNSIRNGSPPSSPHQRGLRNGNEDLDGDALSEEVNNNVSVYLGSRCTTDTLDTDLDSFRGSTDDDASSSSSSSASRAVDTGAGARSCGSTSNDDGTGSSKSDDGGDASGSDEDGKEEDNNNTRQAGGTGGDDVSPTAGGGPTAATSYLFGNPVSERVSDLLEASNRLAMERHREGEGTLRQSSSFMEGALNEGKVSVSCMSFSPNNKTNAFVLGTTTGALLVFADLLQSLHLGSSVATTHTHTSSSSSAGAGAAGRKITLLDAHRDAVTDLVWAPPLGEMLLSLSLDAFVIVWDMRRLNKIRQISTAYQPLVAAFLPKNTNFFLVGLRRQSTIRVYNLSTGICVRKVACGSAVGAMAVDHGGGSAVVLTGDARGELAAFLYPMSTGEVVKACSITVEAHFPIVSVSCQTISAAQRKILLSGMGTPAALQKTGGTSSSTLYAAAASVTPTTSLVVLVSSRCDVISLYLLEEVPVAAASSASGATSTGTPSSIMSTPAPPGASAATFSSSSSHAATQYYFALARRVTSLYRIRHFNAKSSFCADSWHSVAFVSGSEDGTIRVVTCTENGAVQTSALLNVASSSSQSTTTNNNNNNVCTSVAWAHGSTHLVAVTADGRLMSWPRIVVSEDWSAIQHLTQLQQQQQQGVMNGAWLEGAESPSTSHGS